MMAGLSQGGGHTAKGGAEARRGVERPRGRHGPVGPPHPPPPPTSPRALPHSAMLSIHPHSALLRPRAPFPQPTATTSACLPLPPARRACRCHATAGCSSAVASPSGRQAANDEPKQTSNPLPRSLLALPAAAAAVLATAPWPAHAEDSAAASGDAVVNASLQAQAGSDAFVSVVFTIIVLLLTVVTLGVGVQCAVGTCRGGAVRASMCTQRSGAGASMHTHARTARTYCKHCHTHTQHPRTHAREQAPARRLQR